MVHTSSESNKKSKIILKYQDKSPSIDEGSCEGSFSGGDGSLKKGPWTSAEDAVLVDYIKKHGEGNWNAVQKHTGLSRCGKSCRLRWTNHLRPDLKKGPFTSDEEQLIIKLHAKMGNRWAKMAAHLPGRTDNEIKNYWNTRTKRLQRAGLPIYPPNICLRSSNENQSQCSSEFGPHDKLDNDVFQPSSFDTTDVMFDNFKVNQGSLSYLEPFPNISVGSMLNQGLGSQSYGIIFPTVNHKTTFPSFHDNAICGLPPLEQFSSSERIHRPFGMEFPYDPDPGNENLAPLFGVLSDCCAPPNGNFSTSLTLPGAGKFELPSLQYPATDPSSWLVSPLPSEAVDAYDESPSSVSVRSDCISHQNNGLLEAILPETQAIASADNKLSKKNFTSSTIMLSDLGESSAHNLHNMNWRDSGDPMSPLGGSAASGYSANTPPTSASSLDESSPGKASGDLNVKPKHVEHVARQDKERENSPPIGLSRHDILLGSDWRHNVSEVHNTMGNAIAALLDDLCDEYLRVPLDPHLH